MDNVIKRTREKFNLTQDEMAVKLGVTRELISKMENGKMPISHKTIFKINEVFYVNKKSQNNLVEEEEGIYIPKRLLHLLESQQRTIESQQGTIHQLAIEPQKKSGRAASG